MTTKQTIAVALFTGAIASLATYWITNPATTTTTTPAVVVPPATSTTSICMDYPNDPQSTLTTGFVRAMITKYEKKQLNDIQVSTNDPIPADAKSIWFDLETLKKFLYHIENDVRNNSEIPSTKLGVRIYYAAYPDKETIDKLSKFQSTADFYVDPAYPNLHTLVMIPTISNEDGVNFDFNPIDPKTYDGFVNMKLQDKYSYLNNTYSTLSIGPSSDPANNRPDTDMGARNHGMLYPPSGTGSSLAF